MRNIIMEMIKELEENLLQMRKDINTEVREELLVYIAKEELLMNWYEFDETYSSKIKQLNSIWFSYKKYLFSQLKFGYVDTEESFVEKKLRTMNW